MAESQRHLYSLERDFMFAQIEVNIGARELNFKVGVSENIKQENFEGEG